MKDLAFTEQLAGHYGAYTNDQPCKIDESLISDIHWILDCEMYKCTLNTQYVKRDEDILPLLWLKTERQDANFSVIFKRACHVICL